MCAERIQRVLMATVLAVALYLFSIGEVQFGIIIQSFVILMVLVWAFTNFCPSLWAFKKIFGECDFKKE